MEAEERNLYFFFRSHCSRVYRTTRKDMNSYPFKDCRLNSNFKNYFEHFFNHNNSNNIYTCDKHISSTKSDLCVLSAFIEKVYIPF